MYIWYISYTLYFVYFVYFVYMHLYNFQQSSNCKQIMVATRTQATWCSSRARVKPRTQTGTLLSVKLWRALPCVIFLLLFLESSSRSGFPFRFRGPGLAMVYIVLFEQSIRNIQTIHIVQIIQIIQKIQKTRNI